MPSFRLPSPIVLERGVLHVHGMAFRISFLGRRLPADGNHQARGNEDPRLDDGFHVGSSHVCCLLRKGKFLFRNNPSFIPLLKLLSMKHLSMVLLLPPISMHSRRP